MHNDILCAIDNRRTVILLMLNVSAAFDAVDHAILLSRLRIRFGIAGKLLLWLQSYMYLSNRTQYVSVDGGTSAKHPFECGVPQGSVLGRILYLLYTFENTTLYSQLTSSHVRFTHTLLPMWNTADPYDMTTELSPINSSTSRSDLLKLPMMERFAI